LRVKKQSQDEDAGVLDKLLEEDEVDEKMVKGGGTGDESNHKPHVFGTGSASINARALSKSPLQVDREPLLDHCSIPNPY